MGGDRDGDGLYASNIPQENDPDDALTLFESNYMSNMSPQHQRGFNGAGGIWRKVEQWIQDDLVAERTRRYGYSLERSLGLAQKK